MKICLKQFIVMYLLCISFVLCSISCDGRSVLPSRSKPGSMLFLGDPTSKMGVDMHSNWMYPKEDSTPSWLLPKVNQDSSSIFPSLFSSESSQVPSYQYPIPTVQPNYYQIPNAPSYPTSFEYQTPQFPDRLQENLNSWNQYQSPLTTGGVSGLSISDLLSGSGSFGGGSSYGSGSSYGGNSGLRLPSSFNRQPEIVITEFPSRYDKFEPFYPSMNSNMGKYISPMYNSAYGKASSSAQASSMPNIPSSGGWPVYGSLDGFDRSSLSANSGLRRNFGNDDSVNGGSKATEAAAPKGVANEPKGVESDSRRFLSSTVESKREQETKSVAPREDTKSATNNNSNPPSARRSNTQIGKAAESKNVATAQQQSDEMPQNDNLEIDTRLDLSSLDKDTTQNE
ncbi:uncharacterized protein LOC123299987 [Chrysoperla carnea]|uniref:uncharacterized protein LOC123299987 n=1 Tax=Chrysoperla carnea TaxID=189513 RepID=UPI001D07347D|nr:uncharacterized protein LOC123299987 [Chrysoperla carnea]